MITIYNHKSRCPICRAYITNKPCTSCHSILHEKIPTNITTRILPNRTIHFNNTTYHAPPKALPNELWDITHTQPFTHKSHGSISNNPSLQILKLYFPEKLRKSFSFTIPNITSWNISQFTSKTFIANICQFHTYHVNGREFEFENGTSKVPLVAYIDRGIIKEVSCKLEIDFSEWIAEQNSSVQWVEDVDLDLVDPLDLGGLLYEGTIFQWYLWQKLGYPSPHVVLQCPTPVVILDYAVNGSSNAIAQLDLWLRENEVIITALARRWLGVLATGHEVWDLLHELLQDAMGIKFQLSLEDLLLTPKKGIYLMKA